MRDDAPPSVIPSRSPELAEGEGCPSRGTPDPGSFDSLRLAQDDKEGAIRAIAVRSPFTMQRIVRELPAGGSVADMLAALGLPRDVPARINLTPSIPFSLQ